MQYQTIDHFAFRVSNTDFETAKQWLQGLPIEYDEQDHHYFHSIYLTDPDGHRVELTTLVVAENEFWEESSEEG